MEKASTQVDDEDEDEEDARPRGTQQKPTQIDDDSDDSIGVQEERRKTIKKIKREKQSLGRAGSSESGEEEVDAMDTD